MNLRAAMRFLRVVFTGRSFEDEFNVPVKFRSRDKVVVNERLIEIPFVMSCIPREKFVSILDFGCARNWLALSLANLGHKVWGVDFRDYPFENPNLKIINGNVIDLELSELDYIIALSTLEHVGLGTYNDEPDAKLQERVISKLYDMLTSGGKLILTVPVGKSSVDSFERSYTPEDIDGLLCGAGFEKEFERYYRKISNSIWQKCKIDEIRNVDNSEQARKKAGSGVNGIGCYLFGK